MSRSTPSLHAFLEQFDAYVEARANLKKTAEGSDDERLCLDRCAYEWDALRARRAAIEDAA